MRHTRSHLAQKDQEDEMVLTELGIEGWTGAAVLAAKSGGGETELASWVEGGGAPGSWTPQIDAGCSCGEARGSGGRNRHRGEDKRRQWHLPAAAVLAERCGGAGGSRARGGVGRKVECRGAVGCV